MSDGLKRSVQIQFGASAAAYATSEVHAKGESLTILAELLAPQPTWQVLDVATGAGHTALRFAPQVANVIATDLTPEMLRQTAELASKRGLTNVETKRADAESLPFEPASFDLVTCRLALHHFPNPRQAIQEMARVLKPGGWLGFTDNVVVADQSAAGYYNAYEKLRDPSHNWVYPVARLQAMFEQAGLTITATRQLSKEFEFHQWADRMQVSEVNKQKLRQMMQQLPATLQPLFAPRWPDGTPFVEASPAWADQQPTFYFSLWEWVCVARQLGE